MPESLPHHQHISEVSTQNNSQTFIISAGGNVYNSSAGSTDPQEALKEAVKDCRKALLLTDPYVDRETVITTKGKRVAGTCEWITRNESYRTWLDGDGSGNETRLLWISGGPGKGKTMLSLFLTEELERYTADIDRAELAFFFCSAQDEKRNTAIAVLRGLVYQIITKRPQLVKHVQPHFETPEWTQQALSSLETLWLIFTKLIADTELGIMFCVLDGLDECEESTLSVLLTRIFDLFSSASSPTTSAFRLVVVSRDVPILRGCTRIRIDPDNDEQVVSDINLFVSARIQELSSIPGFNDSYRAEVKEALLQGAKGTFLWVGLAVRELLEKRTVTAIEKTLRGLPSGLPAIYSHILRKIPADQKATSCAILRWVTMAQCPLKLLQLASVAGIEAPNPLISIEQAVSDEISHCKLLLVTEHQEVELIHQSARDYILQKDPSADTPPEPFRVIPDDAHSEIAQTCLNHISRTASKLKFSTLDGGSCSHSALIGYAIRHWPRHVQSCSTLDAKLLRSLVHFFEKSHFVRRDWWEAYRKIHCSHLPRVLPLLHMLCYLENEQLVQRILVWDRWRPRSLKRIDSRDGNGRTALHIAAYEGKEAVVRLLVDSGADIEAKKNYGETALHIAAYKGKEAVVQLLVDSGADIEARNNGGETALHIAAYEGKEAVVRLLVGSGADIEAKNNGGKTALHIAAYKGKEAVVQLLVDSGADIEVRNNGGETALHIAAREGDESIVQLLVDRGADVEAKSNEGSTALHHATRSAQSQALGLPRFLLDRGAKVDEKDEAGETALILAARSRDESVVQLLINRRADIKAKSDDGWTALHWAIMRGYEDAARQLIAEGADVRAETKNGFTVVQAAIGKGNKELVRLLKDSGAR